MQGRSTTFFITTLNVRNVILIEPVGNEVIMSEPTLDEFLDGFMDICQDLICNAIKPYNFGWREDENWLPAEV